MAEFTGEYFEHTSEGLRQSIYYTFTPKPLMGNIFYTLDEELSSLLVNAHRALGKLEGMSAYMADDNMLHELNLFKECCYSRQIDYSDADYLSQLSAYGSGQTYPTIQNIIFAHNRLSEKDSSLNTLPEIYGVAVHGLNSSKTMGVRKVPVFLKDAVANFRQYNPTAPMQITPALQDIYKYFTNNSSDALIKAALVHYQFEMIHPFEYYNGIIGRILINQNLLCAGILAANYLSISEQLYEAKNTYFDILSSTQKSGGYLRWIKFFVKIISNAANHSIEIIEKYQRIISDDETKLKKHIASSNNNAFAVYKYWKKHLISNITHVSKNLNLSFNTVDRSVQMLVGLNILRQISSSSRNRQYMYTDIVNLFAGQDFGS